jgi:hypothetical protein
MVRDGLLKLHSTSVHPLEPGSHHQPFLILSDFEGLWFLSLPLIEFLPSILLHSEWNHLEDLKIRVGVQRAFHRFSARESFLCGLNWELCPWAGRHGRD